MRLVSQFGFDSLDDKSPLFDGGHVMGGSSLGIGGFSSPQLFKIAFESIDPNVRLAVLASGQGHVNFCSVFDYPDLRLLIVPFPSPEVYLLGNVTYIDQIKPLLRGKFRIPIRFGGCGRNNTRNLIIRYQEGNLTAETAVTDAVCLWLQTKKRHHY